MLLGQPPEGCSNLSVPIASPRPSCLFQSGEKGKGSVQPIPPHDSNEWWFSNLSVLPNQLEGLWNPYWWAAPQGFWFSRSVMAPEILHVDQVLSRCRCRGSWSQDHILRPLVESTLLWAASVFQVPEPFTLCFPIRGTVASSYWPSYSIALTRKLSCVLSIQNFMLKTEKNTKGNNLRWRNLCWKPDRHAHCQVSRAKGLEKQASYSSPRSSCWEPALCVSLWPSSRSGSARRLRKRSQFTAKWS